MKGTPSRGKSPTQKNEQRQRLLQTRRRLGELVGPQSTCEEFAAREPIDLSIEHRAFHVACAGRRHVGWMTMKTGARNNQWQFATHLYFPITLSSSGFPSLCPQTLCGGTAIPNHETPTCTPYCSPRQCWLRLGSTVGQRVEGHGRRCCSILLKCLLFRLRFLVLQLSAALL